MRKALVTALLLLAPLTLMAQSSATLLVLSKQAHTLSIVDPASLHVIATMPVGDDPHEVIASTDGTRAYVSNYGFGALHTLAVLDLVAHQPLAFIDLGPLRGPHGLTYVDGKVWFTAEAAKALGRYDPASNNVDWVLGTGQNRTHMLFVSADQQRIITTNVSSGTVSLLQQETLAMPGPPPGMQPPPGAGAMPPPSPRTPRTDWNQTVIPVGSGPEGFDISPDGREAWIANAQDGTISVIDLAGRKVVQTIAADVRGANRLKFTPDGAHALVSSLSGADLVLFDVATRQPFKRIRIGHGAAGIQVQPDGARAFIACTPDNYVAVVDLRTYAVTGHIEAGGAPDGLAWAVRP